MTTATDLGLYLRNSASDIGDRPTADRLVEYAVAVKDAGWLLSTKLLAEDDHAGNLERIRAGPPA